MVNRTTRTVNRRTQKNAFPKRLNERISRKGLPSANPSTLIRPPAESCSAREFESTEKMGANIPSPLAQDYSPSTQSHPSDRPTRGRAAESPEGAKKTNLPNGLARLRRASRPSDTELRRRRIILPRGRRREIPPASGRAPSLAGSRWLVRVARLTRDGVAARRADSRPRSRFLWHYLLGDGARGVCVDVASLAISMEEDLASRKKITERTQFPKAPMQPRIL